MAMRHRDFKKRPQAKLEALSAVTKKEAREEAEALGTGLNITTTFPCRMVFSRGAFIGAAMLRGLSVANYRES